MRKRATILTVLTVLGVIAIARAQDIQTVIGNVFLQDVTPGTAQVGHANVTGTLRAGRILSFQATDQAAISGVNQATGAGSSVGGSFTAAQESSVAVRGVATATTGRNFGVFGDTRSSQGIGVLGVARAKDAFGVWARNTNSQGPALVAENTAGGVAARFFGSTSINGFASIQGQLAVIGSSSEISGRDTLGGLPFRATWGNNQSSNLQLRKTGSSANVLLVGSTDFSRIDLVSKNAVQVSIGASANGTGSVTADVKNFVQPDPDNAESDIVYACVEGPEAAAYVRGTARLVNGVARVTLPRHFQNVATLPGMTIQLTPLSRSSRGLAVTRKSLSFFEVSELMNGSGAYEFDWEVKAVRRGFTDYKVYEPWDKHLPTGQDRETAMAARKDNARSVYGIEYAARRP